MARLWRANLCRALAVAACLLVLTFAADDAHDEQLHRRAQTDLRILALGDSITYGWWSADLNGYRLDLLQMLQHVDYSAEMIGYRHVGSMVNNDNEGWPGLNINEIHKAGFEALNGSLPLPNVVLLHAGSNDAIGAVSRLNGKSPSTINVPALATQMISDLKDLIDDMFVRAPNTCLILAQLVMSQDPNVQNIINVYNGYIPYLIDDYVKAGKNVVGVSNSNIDLNGPDHDSIWSYDPYHPGTLGYVKMASNWFLGIQAADQEGRISKPPGTDPFQGSALAPLGPIDGNPSTQWAYQCVYNATWSSKAAGFGGIGKSNQGYKSSWTASQDATGGKAGQALKNGYVWIADMDGNGLPDYVYVDPGFGGLHVWHNLGGGAWSAEVTSALGSSSTDGAGIILADLNGDGKTDYLWQSPAGDLSLFWSYGTTWVSAGKIATGFGGSRLNTHFADIDGDGRADLIWIDSSGNINTWLNTGSGTAISWNQVGKIASGLGHGDLRDRFVDVNGDGRADYVAMTSDGSWSVWLNPDITGFGAAPTLVSAGTFMPSGGPNNPANVTIADLNGDGRADFIAVDYSSGGLTAKYNTGSDGYGQLRFADGNKDGLADVFFVDNNGNVQVWQNKNGSFASPAQKFSAPGLGPTNIRIADINGDGFADIITIDPMKNCSLHAYAGKADFTYTDVGIIRSTRPSGCDSCSGIQFMDSNGDGREDLVCVTSGGDAWLTLNQPPSGSPNSFNIEWEYFGWLLINQGISRNQVRWGDLDGDGFDDTMIVDSSGGIHAYIHGTLAALRGGNPSEFPDIGVPYNQVALADMNGDGRVDYLQINPQNGALSVWTNMCQDSGFPRKPGIPRPHSPGTSISRGPAAPTIVNHGSSPTNGISSIGTGPWTKTTCGQQPTNSAAAGTVLGNTPKNPTAAMDLWAESGADAALADIINAYNNRDVNVDPGNFDSFLIASLVTGTFSSDCVDITSSDCFDGVTECSITSNSPAVLYIATACRNLHNLYSNWYLGYEAGALNVGLHATEWSNAFVQTQNAKAVALQNAVIGAVTAFAGIPLERAFAPLSDVSEDLGAAFTGVITNTVSQTAALVNSQIMPLFAPATAALEAQTVVGNIFNASVYGQTSLLSKIFNGSDMTILQNLLKGGALLYPPQNLASSGYTSATTDVFNSLFQTGWPIAGTSLDIPWVYFIPYYAWDCAAGDVTKSKTVFGELDNVWACCSAKSPADFMPVRVCDQYNNAYFLFNAGYYESQVSGGQGDQIHPFPGENLIMKPNPTYGGVTVPQMVLSAFQGFVASNFNNSRSAAPFTPDPTVVSAPPPPGFFPFPVCTSKEVAANFIAPQTGDAQTFPTFPCPVDGSASLTNLQAVLIGNLQGWAPGSCKVTWGISGPDNNKKVTIYLYDNFGHPLADQDQYVVNYASGVTNFPVTSQLPGPVEVSVGNNVLNFMYQGVSWPSSDKSSPHGCSHDGGKGQCFFPCDAVVQDLTGWKPVAQ